MSRKKVEQTALNEETEVAVLSVTTNEPNAVANGTRAEQEPPLVPGESNDSKVSEDNGQQRTYPPEPNPRKWAHNNVAGVELWTSREPYEARLAFKDKPLQPVIDFLKENGFRWNRDNKVWTRPVNFDTQAQDRLIASRTYHKAVEMICEEMGLAPEPEQEQSF